MPAIRSLRRLLSICRPAVPGATAIMCLIACRLSFAQTINPDAERHPQSDAAYQSQVSSSPLKSAMAASLRLLLMEHSGRVAFQPKTRRELGGPFFADYKRSV